VFPNALHLPLRVAGSNLWRAIGHPEVFNYEGVSKSFRNGRLERELQMVQLPASRCSCDAMLWVSLVSFAATTLCFASQRVFVVAVDSLIDSVRKLLDTPSYLLTFSRRMSQSYSYTEHDYILRNPKLPIFTAIFESNSMMNNLRSWNSVVT
jgi:hypothetical protein